MRHWLAFSLCVCASNLLWAQQNDCAALTRQALEVSGIIQSLDTASETAATDAFLSQIAGSGSGTAQVTATLKPIVKRHLASEVLREKLESRLAYDCNPEQMSRVIAELQSPLVARMLALEAATLTPEGREKTQRYARAISIAPPPDGRVDAIEAVDASAGATDYSVDSLIAVTRGMLAGAEMYADVAAEFEGHRRELAAQMHRAVQISMLSTYRTATTDDLQEYSRQLSSEPLKGFYERVKRACLQIFEEQARAMGHDMKAAMSAQLARHQKNP